MPDGTVAGKSNASRALGGARGRRKVPGDPRPLSDRNGCTVANGGASVPEVAPAKLEGIFAVVVVPHVLEPAHRPGGRS